MIDPRPLQANRNRQNKIVCYGRRITQPRQPHHLLALILHETIDMPQNSDVVPFCNPHLTGAKRADRKRRIMPEAHRHTLAVARSQ